ncbi:unnamed protein product [Linum trigynum]|uniref:Transposase MuDR plant domain-containing protein n=1 Tax=Linum trigynum TaxID=586398 RepID=A0AAV2EEB6_9ROSI
MAYQMPVYDGYEMVYEESILSDDDGINIILDFVHENRFRVVEVYIETEEVGEYGGGANTEHGEGSGGVGGSGGYGGSDGVPWPRDEANITPGPMVEDDGQEWPAWGKEWVNIGSSAQGSVRNDYHCGDKATPPPTSEETDMEDLASVSSEDDEGDDDDDDDDDDDVDEGVFEPPTPHYTMVPQHPLYAHNDDSDYHPVPIWSPNAGFVVGQTFGGKPNVMDALKEYAMQKSFRYRVHKSYTKKIHVRCENYGDGCMWQVRAAFVMRQGAWLIRKADNIHTYSSSIISLDHRQLNARKVHKPSSIWLRHNLASL